MKTIAPEHVCNRSYRRAICKSYQPLAGVIPEEHCIFLSVSIRMPMCFEEMQHVKSRCRGRSELPSKKRLRRYKLVPGHLERRAGERGSRKLNLNAKYASSIGLVVLLVAVSPSGGRNFRGVSR